jgi:hypothetical protein
MEILITFLMAPIVAIWFLLTTSWWVGCLFFGVFGISTYNVHGDDSNDVFAFFLLAIGVLVSLFCLNYFGTDNGAMQALQLSGVAIGAGLKYYIIWGVISAGILWIFEALRFRRKYKATQKRYEEMIEEKKKHKVPEDDIDKDDIWESACRWENLKSDKPLDARTGEGARTIFSFFAIWPLHMINLFFGEFLSQVPELIKTYLGGPLNAVTKILTGGVSGRPD